MAVVYGVENVAINGSAEKDLSSVMGCGSLIPLSCVIIVSDQITHGYGAAIKATALVRDIAGMLQDV